MPHRNRCDRARDGRGRPVHETLEQRARLPPPVRSRTVDGAGSGQHPRASFLSNLCLGMELAPLQRTIAVLSRPVRESPLRLGCLRPPAR
eukprot:3683890-Prymnesium_polylepis.1